MKTIITAWLMTAIQANGGIASFKITETEQICREIVCAAQFGESCAGHDRSMAKADKDRLAQEDAWAVKNPKRAAYCKTGLTGSRFGGLSWSLIGADGNPCGPEHWINLSSTARAASPTDVVAYHCTEAKPE